MLWTQCRDVGLKQSADYFRKLKWKRVQKNIFHISNLALEIFFQVLFFSQTSMLFWTTIPTPPQCITNTCTPYLQCYQLMISFELLTANDPFLSLVASVRTMNEGMNQNINTFAFIFHILLIIYTLSLLVAVFGTHYLEGIYILYKYIPTLDLSITENFEFSLSWKFYVESALDTIHV